jgi:hypothetical protein
MQIALFLGAGFSKWSCDLPLVADLFDFAVRVHSATMHPLDHPEIFVGYAQGHGLRFNLVNWYITRRLTEPFIVASSRRYTWYINSYHARHHPGILKAGQFLEMLSCIGHVSMLTTNYDMVPEYALGTRGFNYGTVGEQIGFTPYPHPRPVYVTGDRSIAKLHGSISWDESKKFPDLRCGLTGKCLIVPPVTEKLPPKLLQKQWSLAKKNLAACDALLVFGFSFNESDKAIRKFVAKNLAPTANVVLIDVVDHRKRLLSIFGSRNIDYVSSLDVRLGDTLDALLTSAKPT